MNTLSSLRCMLAFLLLFAFLGAGCLSSQTQNPTPSVSTGATGPAPAARLQVVTSFRPITLLVEAVAGPDADIIQLLPPGASPHEYEPTPKDVKALENGSILFYDAPELEPWATSLAASANPSMKLAAFSDAIPASALANLQAQPGFPTVSQDPHLWLSPQLAIYYAPFVAQKLSHADPVHGSAYSQRAQVLVARLKTLDADYSAGLANCSTRTFLTSHAFLDYTAAAYNLTAISIAGLSPDAEPSVEQFAAILNESKAAHVQGVLSEPDELQSLSQTVASELNLPLYPFATMEILPPASPTQGNARDYVAVMENNLQQMRKALACS